MWQRLPMWGCDGGHDCGWWWGCCKIWRGGEMRARRSGVAKKDAEGENTLCSTKKRWERWKKKERGEYYKGKKNSTSDKAIMCCSHYRKAKKRRKKKKNFMRQSNIIWDDVYI